MDADVRIQALSEKEIPLIARYWHESGHDYLRGMGVDVEKLPAAGQMEEMLTQQVLLPVEKKRSYCLIWFLDDQPVGHCNTNPIFFGEEGFMHLHFWNDQQRNKGLGTRFLQLSIADFFNTLHFKRIISEPWALNPAPNRILPKLGFKLEKTYTTVPGSINFEQEVNRWVLYRKDPG